MTIYSTQRGILSKKCSNWLVYQEAIEQKEISSWQDGRSYRNTSQGYLLTWHEQYIVWTMGAFYRSKIKQQATLVVLLIVIVGPYRQTQEAKWINKGLPVYQSLMHRTQLNDISVQLTIAEWFECHYSSKHFSHFKGSLCFQLIIQHFSNNLIA